MPRKSANVSLKSFDDIFSTEESRQEEKLEHIQQIPLSELHAFEGHPFRVVDDEEMQKVVDSVKEFGILTPLIARPDPYGGYEIISGHRRLHASELAGLESMMMKPLSSWWMRIFREKTSCRVNGRGRIG